MTNNPNEKNIDLSMLVFVYGLFQTLGGFESTFKIRGDRLRSYEAKRDFFSDDMIDKLLAAFAGNPQFTHDKKQAKKKGEETYSQYDETEKTFYFLFEKIEETIFFMQRESDFAFYEEQPPNQISHEIYSLIIIISTHLTKKANRYVKTCPFLYVEKCLTTIVKNDLDIPKTIKIMAREYLDKLCQNHPKNLFSINDYLGKITKEDHLKSLYTLSLDISSLRSELQQLHKGPLTIDQEEQLQKLQGTYNCLLALSRFETEFQQLAPPLTENNINGLYNFLRAEITPFTSREPINSASIPNYIKISHLRRKQYFYNLNSPRSVINQLKNLDELFVSLENFDSIYIDTLLMYLKSRFDEVYPEHKILTECLINLQKNDRDKAKRVISTFLPYLSTAPYALRKLACTLYLGLKLSETFKITPNEIDAYIAIYLEASLPSTEFYMPSSSSDEELLNKFQTNRYDHNYGLIRILKEYNKFIIFNQLNTDLLLANPLNNINSFFEKFFINFEHQETKNTFEQSRASLYGLKTLLRNARKASLISFELKELKSPLILLLLGLGTEYPLQGYSKIAAINQFLMLPDSTQEAILDACEEELDAMFPKKKESAK